MFCPTYILVTVASAILKAWVRDGAGQAVSYIRALGTVEKDVPFRHTHTHTHAWEATLRSELEGRRGARRLGPLSFPSPASLCRGFGLVL